MRRVYVVLALMLSMMVVGCSSGVSQKDYDDLKAENERLQQRLEEYEGPANQDNSNAPDSPASDFKYVNNGSAVQINGYTGKGGNVVIPDEIEGVPVTRIAKQAFSKCDNITGIALPKNLEYIGDMAFYGLENLKGVLIIPEKVTEIEGHAFQSTGLQGLVIKGSCKVDINAFANIYSLSFLYIEDGCSCRIGKSVFGYNTDLKTAIIPASVQIKDDNFEGCNNLTFYTTPGSPAETYAKDNFIKVNTEAYSQEVSKYAGKY